MQGIQVGPRLPPIRKSRIKTKAGPEWPFVGSRRIKMDPDKVNKRERRAREEARKALKD